MNPNITPHGIVLEVKLDNETYLAFIQNDFERFKTYKNYDLSLDTLILFDKDFNRLSFDKDSEKVCELYEKIEELLEEELF